MIVKRKRTKALYDVEVITPEFTFHIRDIQRYLKNNFIPYDTINCYELPFKGIVTPKCVYLSPRVVKVTNDKVSFCGCNLLGVEEYLTIPKDDYFHLKDLMS